MSGQVETFTVTEAALRFRVSKALLTQLARDGLVDAVKVDGRWLYDGADVAAHVARRRARDASRVQDGTAVPRVDARPLLRQIELRGGPAAVGVRQHSADEKALERAQRDGWLSPELADRLAIRLLGLTMWELWPDEAC